MGAGLFLSEVDGDDQAAIIGQEPASVQAVILLKLPIPPNRPIIRLASLRDALPAPEMHSLA